MRYEELAEFSNDQLLAALKEEREKYTKSDRARMQIMCDELVARGVYPAKSGIDYPPLRMVENWGVDWHQYRGLMNCPHCGADLRDPKGAPFKREIGISNGDSVMHWQCPEESCKKTWPRSRAAG